MLLYIEIRDFLAFLEQNSGTKKLSISPAIVAAVCEKLAGVDANLATVGAEVA